MRPLFDRFSTASRPLSDPYLPYRSIAASTIRPISVS